MNISVITLIKGSLFHIKDIHVKVWIARLCLRMTTHEWKFPPSHPPTPGHVLIWADSIMIPSCRESTVYQNGLILKLINLQRACNVLNKRPIFRLPVPCTADHYRRQHKFWIIMIFKFVPRVRVFTGKIEKSSCNPQPFSLPVIGSVITLCRLGQIWFHYHQLIPDYIVDCWAKM